MANEQAPRDDNHVPTILGKDNVSGQTKPALIDSITGRLLVSATTIATGATTTAVTSVSGSATSVTLLAIETGRLGATIINDSTAVLYLKLGATATTASFTIKLYQDDYYEVPADYTGVIDGVWASATGDARITELT